GFGGVPGGVLGPTVGAVPTGVTAMVSGLLRNSRPPTRARAGVIVTAPSRVARSTNITRTLEVTTVELVPQPMRMDVGRKTWRLRISNALRSGSSGSGASPPVASMLISSRNVPPTGTLVALAVITAVTLGAGWAWLG